MTASNRPRIGPYRPSAATATRSRSFSGRGSTRSSNACRPAPGPATRRAGRQSPTPTGRPIGTKPITTQKSSAAWRELRMQMETVGLGLFFEDLPVGRQFKTIGRTVTEADITNFVNCTGMVEVLFTNTEFLAQESDIKGRPAPGALVYCFAEGLLVQATMQHTGFAFLHMELSIERPVVAGDTVHAECEIIEARLSKSRPGRGLVRTRNRIVNQRGEAVQTYNPLRMVKCREG